MAAVVSEVDLADFSEIGVSLKEERRTHLQMLGQLGNSGTEYTLEELALHTKSITTLTIDFGIKNCILFKVKDRSEWQVTDFDVSWGFLCGQCGIKLSEKLNTNE